MASAMSGTLQQLENHENWQTLYEILAEANPGDQNIQRELGKLSNNKDTYIKQLQAQWDARPQPMYTQADIKRLCSNYYARETENDIIDDLQERPTGKMSPRDWVIKDDNIWKGWDPELSEYFDLPIRFDAEIKFEKFYEQLVVSDRELGSCNLIWTIKKLIDRGGASCLSDANWIALWLQFSKKYMASAYATLSRYSDDLETLFKTLVTNINADEELSKL